VSLPASSSLREPNALPYRSRQNYLLYVLPRTISDIRSSKDTIRRAVMAGVVIPVISTLTLFNGHGPACNRHFAVPKAVMSTVCRPPSKTELYLANRMYVVNLTYFVPERLASYQAGLKHIRFFSQWSDSADERLFGTRITIIRSMYISSVSSPR
jgi:hypothetical protein